MEIFLSLLIKLLPLYGLILIGFFAGRFLKVNKEKLAALLIYVIIPVVIFHSVSSAPLSVSTLSLPLIFFFLTCLLSIICYFLAGLLWKNATKNIIAYMSGSANTGYFGLPVAFILFGNESVQIVALIVLGTALYSNSFGFFLAAKGHHSTRESLLKVIKLPMLYAFFLGIFVNYFHISFGPMEQIVATFFTNALTVLGMMLIGVALSEIKQFTLDVRFIGFSLFAKFVLWPIAIVLLILFDQLILHFFSEKIYHIFIIMSVVPIAANMVTFATVLKNQPEKVSVAVVISTLASLFIIPLITILFLT